MAGIGKCKDAAEDPVLAYLRESFNAIPLKVPEGRFQPLDVLAFRNGRARYLGAVEGLFPKGEGLKVQPGWKVDEEDMATVSGAMQRAADAGVRLNVLGGLLSGFGITGGEVSAAFKSAAQISFSFDGVKRRYYQIGRIGQLVADRKLDTKNAVMDIFRGKEPYDFLVLDSVIQSDNLSIHIGKADAAGVSAKLPGVMEYLGEVELSAKKSHDEGLKVTFKGPPLTFAFSCVQFYPDEHGRIYRIAPEVRNIAFVARNTNLVQNPDNAVLKDVSLLELEEPKAG